MPAVGANPLWRSRALVFGAALVVFLALPNAQANTPKHRKRTEFSVTLQPFSLVHSAVRAVAEPVVSQGPRILRAVATAPIRAAYYKPRRIIPRVPRAIQADDYAQHEKRADDGRPIRVALQSSQRTQVPEPGVDSERDYEQDQDQEQEAEATTNRQIERRGDRPTVGGKRAVLRGGVAYAPSRAPDNVKNAIWAGNSLRRKPYVWGGGHGSFQDHGYDCSGSVS